MFKRLVICLFLAVMSSACFPTRAQQQQVVTTSYMLEKESFYKMNRGTGPGYVRLVHPYVITLETIPPTFKTSVVFEKENGEVRTYTIESHGDLPVWIGMHCDITTDWDDDLVSVIRLPD